MDGLADWNIPAWSKRNGDFHVLRNTLKDASVMQAFVGDGTGPGLRFLDSISTWPGEARAFLAERWCFARAADFFLIADDRVSRS